MEELKKALHDIFPEIQGELSAEQIDYAYAQLSQQSVVQIDSVFINERTVLAAFPNPLDGEAVLQALEFAAQNNPVLKRVTKWMSPSEQGIDIGHPSTRTMIDSLSGLVLTEEQVSVIKSLAEKEVPKWPGLSVELIVKAWGE